jgi:hypothetical protein
MGAVADFVLRLIVPHHPITFKSRSRWRGSPGQIDKILSRQ